MESPPRRRRAAQRSRRSPEQAALAALLGAPSSLLAEVRKLHPSTSPEPASEADRPVRACLVRRRGLLRAGFEFESVEVGCVERNQLVLVEEQLRLGGTVRCRLVYPRCLQRRAWRGWCSDGVLSEVELPHATLVELRQAISAGRLPADSGGSPAAIGLGAGVEASPGASDSPEQPWASEGLAQEHGWPPVGEEQTSDTGSASPTPERGRRSQLGGRDGARAVGWGDKLAAALERVPADMEQGNGVAVDVERSGASVCPDKGNKDSEPAERAQLGGVAQEERGVSAGDDLAAAAVVKETGGDRLDARGIVAVAPCAKVDSEVRASGSRGMSRDEELAVAADDSQAVINESSQPQGESVQPDANCETVKGTEETVTGSDQIRRDSRHRSDELEADLDEMLSVHISGGDPNQERPRSQSMPVRAEAQLQLEVSDREAELTEWLKQANAELCEAQSTAATSPKHSDQDKIQHREMQDHIKTLEAAIDENRDELTAVKSTREEEATESLVFDNRRRMKDRAMAEDEAKQGAVEQHESIHNAESAAEEMPARQVQASETNSIQQAGSSSAAVEALTAQVKLQLDAQQLQFEAQLKAQYEQIQLLIQEEADRRKAAADEEASRKAAEEEARKKAIAEEDAQRKAVAANEEAVRKAAEEEAREKAATAFLLAKQKAVESEIEAKRRNAEEEASRKAVEEEASRKAAEAEAARKAAEAEAARKAVEEEAARKAVEEGAARKAVEEGAARKAAEEEAARKATEAEAARKAAEEEAARKAAEEEAARKATEAEAARKAAEEEAARKAAEEEAARKAAEEEAARKAAEEEAARKAAEEEAARKAAEEEAARKATEAEAARKAAEEEAARKAAEEEAARKAAEEEAARKAAEEEAARKAAEEEAARKAAEEEAARAKEALASLEGARQVRLASEAIRISTADAGLEPPAIEAEAGKEAIMTDEATSEGEPNSKKRVTPKCTARNEKSNAAETSSPANGTSDDVETFFDTLDDQQLTDDAVGSTHAALTTQEGTLGNQTAEETPSSVTAEMQTTPEFEDVDWSSRKRSKTKLKCKAPTVRRSSKQGGWFGASATEEPVPPPTEPAIVTTEEPGEGLFDVGGGTEGSVAERSAESLNGEGLPARLQSLVFDHDNCSPGVTLSPDSRTWCKGSQGPWQSIRTSVVREAGPENDCFIEFEVNHFGRGQIYIGLCTDQHNIGSNDRIGSSNFSWSYFCAEGTVHHGDRTIGKYGSLAQSEDRVGILLLGSTLTYLINGVSTGVICDAQIPSGDAIFAAVSCFDEGDVISIKHQGDATSLQSNSEDIMSPKHQRLLDNFQSKRQELYHLQEKLLDSPKSERKRQKAQINEIDLALTNLQNQLSEFRSCRPATSNSSKLLQQRGSNWFRSSGANAEAAARAEDEAEAAASAEAGVPAAVETNPAVQAEDPTAESFCVTVEVEAPAAVDTEQETQAAVTVGFVEAETEAPSDGKESANEEATRKAAEAEAARKAAEEEAARKAAEEEAARKAAEEEAARKAAEAEAARKAAEEEAARKAAEEEAARKAAEEEAARKAAEEEAARKAAEEEAARKAAEEEAAIKAAEEEAARKATEEEAARKAAEEEAARAKEALASLEGARQVRLSSEAARIATADAGLEPPAIEAEAGKEAIMTNEATSEGEPNSKKRVTPKCTARNEKSNAAETSSPANGTSDDVETDTTASGGFFVAAEAATPAATEADAQPGAAVVDDGKDLDSEAKAEPEAGPSESEDQIELAFAKIDANGDGLISKSELVQALRADDQLCEMMGLRPDDLAELDLLVLFKRADTDDDQSISRSEWQALFDRVGHVQAPTAGKAEMRASGGFFVAAEAETPAATEAAAADAEASAALSNEPDVFQAHAAEVEKARAEDSFFWKSGTGSPQTTSQSASAKFQARQEAKLEEAKQIKAQLAAAAATAEEPAAASFFNAGNTKKPATKEPKAHGFFKAKSSLVTGDTAAEGPATGGFFNASAEGQTTKDEELPELDLSVKVPSIDDGANDAASVSDQPATGAATDAANLEENPEAAATLIQSIHRGNTGRHTARKETAKKKFLNRSRSPPSRTGSPSRWGKTRATFHAANITRSRSPPSRSSTPSQVTDRGRKANK